MRRSSRLAQSSATLPSCMRNQWVCVTEGSAAGREHRRDLPVRPVGNERSCLPAGHGRMDDDQCCRARPSCTVQVRSLKAVRNQRAVACVAAGPVPRMSGGSFLASRFTTSAVSSLEVGEAAGSHGMRGADQLIPE